MKTTLTAHSIPMLAIIPLSIITLSLVPNTAGAESAEMSAGLSKTVTYGDLNLSSDQGAKALYARLRGAAREVCAPLESRDLQGQSLWRKCYRDAVASAVNQVDKPAVTALHTRATSQASEG